MKKFAIGCLVALAILIVIGGVVGYLAYDRFLRPVTQFAGSIKQYSEIEKGVRNTGGFTAPEGGELTEQLVGRFVKVQQEMETKLGARMQALKTKYDRLDRERGGNRDASVTEVMAQLRDLGSLLVEAKRVQVEALNEAGFSLREYEWAREQVYAAIGMSAVGFDFKTMAEEAKAGKFGPPSRNAEVPETTEKNKELVAPFEKKLRDWAPFAFFGL
ncbi:MAG TPA: hypothetical protein VGK32_09155 [Vicinamibacterales bacterium]|jgi:hypothetical protein